MKRSAGLIHQSVMWIGAIRVIQTKHGSYAATHASVQAAIGRKGNQLRVFRDARADELERATPRTFISREWS
jgi:hypothetical protein